MGNSMDFAAISNTKEGWRQDKEIEIEGQAEIIDTYSNDTQEWKAAHAE